MVRRPGWKPSCCVHGQATSTALPRFPLCQVGPVTAAVPTSLVASLRLQKCKAWKVKMLYSTRGARGEVNTSHPISPHSSWCEVWCHSIQSNSTQAMSGMCVQLQGRCQAKQGVCHRDCLTRWMTYVTVSPRSVP